MSRPVNIFLVGPMGAGKSSVGRQLARQLNKDFHDSDSEIEQRTGADIPLIFDLEGEEGFRKRETVVIDDLTKQQNIVLATGGGAVLLPENRQYLKERGYVVYLRASIPQILERTQKDKSRPLLQTEDPAKKLQELMDSRDPLYLEVANLSVDTDGRSVKQVVDDILQHLDMT
jgi:shikimate kinase